MDDQQYLEEFQTDLRQKFLSVIVIMSMFCFLGVVGNVFIVFFYGFVTTRKTVTATLIITLACVDSGVSIFMIPNIIELAKNVTFTNVIICKTVHFLAHWMGESSVLTLWCIAIERYRKICHPFKRQMSLRQARYAILVIIIVSLVFSVREIANFDIVDIVVNPNVGENTSYVSGHLCTLTNDPKFDISVKLFLAIDAVFVIAIIVTLLLTYGAILWTIRKASKKMNKPMANREKPMNKTPAYITETHEINVNPDNLNASEQEEDKHESHRPREGSISGKDIKIETETSLNNTTENDQLGEGGGCVYRERMSGIVLTFKDNGKTDGVNETEQNENTERKDTVKKHTNNLRRCAKLKKTERTVTLMMLVVSIVFCLCFIPPYIVRLGLRSYTEIAKLELGAGVQFAIRIIYINSCVNPLIFCMLNSEFRHFVLRTITAGRFPTKK